MEPTTDEMIEYCAGRIRSLAYQYAIGDNDDQWFLRKDLRMYNAIMNQLYKLKEKDGTNV